MNQSGPHDPSALMRLLQFLCSANASLAADLAAARLDTLTSLPQRQEFTARALEVTGKPGAVVILIDLDGFKSVNDSYGHLAGDTVLRASAHRLAGWCGQSGVAGRLGGDEFAAVVTLGLDDDLVRRIGLLRSELARPVEFEGTWLMVHASVGACRMAEAESLSDAMRRADQAMYADKRDRRERAPLGGNLTRLTG